MDLKNNSNPHCQAQLQSLMNCLFVFGVRELRFARADSLPKIAKELALLTLKIV